MSERLSMVNRLRLTKKRLSMEIVEE